MADGFGAQDILTGRGLGLMGFGYPGGYGYGYGGATGFAYGAPAANATRINAVSDRVGDQNEFTRELAMSSNESNRIAIAQLDRSLADDVTRSEMATGFGNIANRDLQNTLMGGQAALSNERRQSDLFMNLNNQINDFRAESAQCCCDTKLLVIEENSKTRELINQRYLDGITRQLDDAQRQIQTQTILGALPNGAPATTCL